MSDQVAQPKPPKPKEYSLSQQERDLLQNQNNLKSQQEYLASLIERDMFIFVNTVVRKRIGVSNDMQITYNVDQGKVFVFPKPEPKKEEKNGQPTSN